MRAAEGDAVLRVNIELSETDIADGVKVDTDYKVNTLKIGPSYGPLYDYTADQWTISQVLGGSNAGDVASWTDLVSFSDDSLADSTAVPTFRLVSGKTVVAGPTNDWNTAKAWKEFDVANTLTLQISLKVDTRGVDGKTTGDGTDDRLQKAYSVHLETGIDSGYYHLASTYYVNNSDDLVKLVTDGDYVNFPGWDYVEFDAEGNEYYYQYTIDGDDIYGDYVKAKGPKFVTTSTNDKDTNGDGKVSCDEYYGTTGLVWSDEKNACVVESNGAVVVTIPNTATK